MASIIEDAYHESMRKEDDIYRRVTESVPEGVVNRHNKSVKRKVLVAGITTFILGLNSPFYGDNRLKGFISSEKEWDASLIMTTASIGKTRGRANIQVSIPQIYGGKNFDQIGALDPQGEKVLIEEIRNGIAQNSHYNSTHYIMPLKDIPFVYTAPEVRIRNITASASSENNEKGTINNTGDPQNMNLAESRGLAIKNILTGALPEGYEVCSAGGCTKIDMKQIALISHISPYTPEELETLGKIAKESGIKATGNKGILELLYKNDTSEKNEQVQKIVNSKRTILISLEFSESGTVKKYHFMLLPWIIFGLMAGYLTSLVVESKLNRLMRAIEALIRKGGTDQEVQDLINSNSYIRSLSA